MWGTTGVVAALAPGVGSLSIGAAAMGIGGFLQAGASLPATFAHRRQLVASWRIVALSAVAVAIYPLAFRQGPQQRLETADDIPLSGVNLNETWLTAVLCKNVPGAEVMSWNSPGGSSGSSERAALRVEYNTIGQAASLPTQPYTKSTPAFQRRMLLSGADVLLGETQFYLDYRPAVEMEAPHGFWGGANLRTGRNLVIMEDIAVSKGARFIDATEPLSRTQVADILANMAAYHGLWWDSQKLAELKTPEDHFTDYTDCQKAADEMPATTAQFRAHAATRSTCASVAAWMQATTAPA